ncbi:MAG TPA: ribonuclease Z [Bacteroidia bacterium]|nr:ribonuclease Z [Bacteroidia bacterium]
MLPFELTILGCSSASPTSSRHPTAQVLNLHDSFFLIDCGEATQIQLRRYKIKIQRIDHIFISHLHGDHYLGLPGLIGTMHLLGRKKELHIYSPPGLKEIIDIHHHHSKTYLNYNLIFHELNEQPQIIYQDHKFTVETILMNHRIPCYGFIFREQVLSRNIIRQKIVEYNIPQEEIHTIKQGEDFTLPDGKVISNLELTTSPHAPRTYAYCSDTIYNESYIHLIKDANLLYHESTFADDMIDRAKQTYHCTAKQAASIAQKANVKKLIIGHYSARYHELDIFLTEAKGVFDNTVLAMEGETYLVS